jgi:hypothetical protein
MDPYVGAVLRIIELSLTLANTIAAKLPAEQHEEFWKNHTKMIAPWLAIAEKFEQLVNPDKKEKP